MIERTLTMTAMAYTRRGSEQSEKCTTGHFWGQQKTFCKPHSIPKSAVRLLQVSLTAPDLKGVKFNEEYAHTSCCESQLNINFLRQRQGKFFAAISTPETLTLQGGTRCNFLLLPIDLLTASRPWLRAYSYATQRIPHLPRTRLR